MRSKSSRWRRQAMGNDPARGATGDSKPAKEAAAVAERTDIPKAEAHKGPEEFRRRVTKGLSEPASGRLKDAVRRYAEGLLR